MTTNDSQTRREFISKSAASTAAVVAGQQFLASGLFAADKKWTGLFNGKTLKGWHKNPQRVGHGTGGTWVVEDGVITGEQDPPGSGNGGILLTDQKFGDFELSIDLMPDWGVCSGLFLRSNDRGQCIQMMVDYHDAGNVGHLYGEGTGGFNTRTFDINGIYDGKKLKAISTDKHKSASEAGLAGTCTPEAWTKAWKVNAWNTARVICTGQEPKITTWINGVKVCEFDGSTSTNDRFKKDREKILKTLGTAGSIAVQVHGGKGWPKGAKCRWKNIKIKELS